MSSIGIIIREQIDRELQGVYTSIPARVNSIDNLESDQTISVKPLVNSYWQDGVELGFAPLDDVYNTRRSSS